MDIRKTSDLIQIKIKKPNPSKEPQVSSKAPNEDLRDMDVLCSFKIQIDSQTKSKAKTIHPKTYTLNPKLLALNQKSQTKYINRTLKPTTKKNKKQKSKKSKI